MNLEYPIELHDTHSDYPLAPESVKVNYDMLSPFQKQLYPENHAPNEKLIPNLYNKEKYILHYRNLKQYLELGMKIKKVFYIKRQI